MAGKLHCIHRLVITVMILFVFTGGITAQPAEPQEALDKVKVLRRAGSDWLDIGVTAYKEGFFIESEKALLRAREYFLYLNDRQRQSLEEYSNKAHEKALKVRKLRMQLEQVESLIRGGELSRAEVMLSKIEGNPPLPEIIAQELQGLKKRLNSKIRQRKKEMNKLYTRSIADYREGNYEEAEKGFSEVAESEFFETRTGLSPQDYLERIASSGSSAKRQAGGRGEKKTTQLPETEKSETDEMLDIAAPAEDKQKKGKDKVDRKENIRRSYARAVVKDAVAQAEKLLKNGQYYKASQSVERAKQIIEKHRDYLGEKLYQEFLSRLEQMKQKIAEQRDRWLGERDANSPWQM